MKPDSGRVWQIKTAREERTSKGNRGVKSKREFCFHANSITVKAGSGHGVSFKCSRCRCPLPRCADPVRALLHYAVRILHMLCIYNHLNLPEQQGSDIHVHISQLSNAVPTQLFFLSWSIWLLSCVFHNFLGAKQKLSAGM